MLTVRIYRLGNFFYRHNIKFLPKICQYINYIINNCDIPTETLIGHNFNVAHGGLGVVINKKAVIGHNVTMAHCITIGGSYGKRPLLTDNIFVGPGSRILGGVIINKFVIIGANSVVVKDVESFHIVGGVPAKVIGIITKDNFEKYKDFFPTSNNPFL